MVGRPSLGSGVPDQLGREPETVQVPDIGLGIGEIPHRYLFREGQREE
jgi:hypothetical protein